MLRCEENERTKGRISAVVGNRMMEENQWLWWEGIKDSVDDDGSLNTNMCECAYAQTGDRDSEEKKDWDEVRNML